MKHQSGIFLIGALFFVFIQFFYVEDVRAQDPQFSQFYAAPLFLNPGMAGSTGMARAGINYRNQWPGIDADFITYSAFFDYFFEDYNSSVGVIVNADREGFAGLRNNSLGLQYAYQLKINDFLTFRPGVEVSYTIRDTNFTGLTFPDQFSGAGFDNPTGENFDTGLSNQYLDFAFGGVFHSRRFFLGYAVHNILEPNQSFFINTDPDIDFVSRLPRRHSIHGGYEFVVARNKRNTIYGSEMREATITPTFQYKRQGNFNQLDINAYFSYEPIVFGAGYRGTPFQTLEGIIKNESIIMIVGFTTDNGLNIGYSYDYVISGLGAASGGAHEVSINYVFPLRDPKLPPKNVRRIPCPKF
ncbi:MAG: type IX secretion system membrane protein PorP/SprF [Cyclobacteriaceae bacterium]|nr:type IX secretion system membrane protein PorP/SprF [Cyclobacteriaceae bacterium]MCH8514899.1 type IX secretion system membrane protein PorP/SprF [Cyclobacteriaceae bacterium]